MLKPVLIHLTEEQFELLKKWCKERSISRSELIRRLLQKHFNIDLLK